ncbi:phosphate transporter (Pho88) [Pichia californica]|uniref:Phosphate transporter (Pho88) n=1 Tax=Pichia californica TaxID=460514 RepID=A0A9P7BHT6_9ASCO|nr:phosphate transporter (Pho88) [[Candida] californica]KAG0690950.1 phosphate transporter (Pho88) [[Candida] californica]
MNPAVTNLVLMLVAMQVSKRLDFEDPTILFYVRLAFVAGQSITLLIYLYTRFVIIKKNDLTTLKYLDSPNKMAGETDSKLVTTTVKDYDLKQIDSAIKGVFTGLAMTGFMHLYMKFANPLVMQSVSPIKGALETNIVKIHLFNTPATGDLKRPFKAAPSLLSNFTGGNVKTDKSSIEKAETAGTGGVKEE